MKDDVVLKAGERLGAAEIGLLATVGVMNVKVLGRLFLSYLPQHTHTHPSFFSKFENGTMDGFVISMDLLLSCLILLS